MLNSVVVKFLDHKINKDKRIQELHDLPQHLNYVSQMLLNEFNVYMHTYNYTQQRQTEFNQQPSITMKELQLQDQLYDQQMQFMLDNNDNLNNELQIQSYINLEPETIQTIQQAYDERKQIEEEYYTQQVEDLINTLNVYADERPQLKYENQSDILGQLMRETISQTDIPQPIFIKFDSSNIDTSQQIEVEAKQVMVQVTELDTLQQESVNEQQIIEPTTINEDEQQSVDDEQEDESNESIIIEQGHTDLDQLMTQLDTIQFEPKQQMDVHNVKQQPIDELSKFDILINTKILDYDNTTQVIMHQSCETQQIFNSIMIQPTIVKQGEKTTLEQLMTATMSTTKLDNEEIGKHVNSIGVKTIIIFIAGTFGDYQPIIDYVKYAQQYHHFTIITCNDINVPVSKQIKHVKFNVTTDIWVQSANLLHELEDNPLASIKMLTQGTSAIASFNNIMQINNDNIVAIYSTIYTPFAKHLAHHLNKPLHYISYQPINKLILTRLNPKLYDTIIQQQQKLDQLCNSKSMVKIGKRTKQVTVDITQQPDHIHFMGLSIFQNDQQLYNHSYYEQMLANIDQCDDLEISNQITRLGKFILLSTGSYDITDFKNCEQLIQLNENHVVVLCQNNYKLHKHSAIYKRFKLTIKQQALKQLWVKADAIICTGGIGHIKLSINTCQPIMIVDLGLDQKYNAKKMVDEKCGIEIDVKSSTTLDQYLIMYHQRKSQMIGILQYFNDKQLANQNMNNSLQLFQLNNVNTNENVDVKLANQIFMYDNSIKYRSYLQLGVFHAKNVQYNVTYDPQVEFECVTMCIKQWLTNLGQQVTSKSQCLQKNQFNQFYTVSTLIEQLLSQFINVGIITHDNQLHLYKPFIAPIMYIQIDDKNSKMHCKLVELQSPTLPQLYQLQLKATTIKQWQLIDMSYSCTELNVTNSQMVACVNDFVNQLDMAKWHKPVDDLKARLNFNNYVNLYNDMQHVITIIDGQFDQQNAIIKPTCQLLNGQVYLILTNMGLQPGLYIKTSMKYGIIILKTKVQCCYNVIMSLRFQWFDSKQSKQQLSTNDLQLAINEETLTFLKQSQIRNVHTTWNQSATNYDLHIFTFDNRAHHQYNLKQAIAQAKLVRWHGQIPSKHDLSQFTQENTTFLRLSYQQGKIVKVIEFSNVKELNVFKYLANKCIDVIKVVNNAMYFTTLNEQHLALLCETYLRSKPSQVQLAQWKISKFVLDLGEQEITSDELLEQVFNNNATAMTVALLMVYGVSTNQDEYNIFVDQQLHEIDHDLTTKITSQHIIMKTNIGQLVICDLQTLQNITFINVGQGYKNEQVVKNNQKLNQGSHHGAWFQSEQSHNAQQNNENWFQLKPKLEVLPNFRPVNDSIALINLNYLQVQQVHIWSCEGKYINEDSWLNYIEPLGFINSINIEQPIKELTPQEVIDLWTNTDLSQWLNMYALGNPGIMRCWEHPERLIEQQVTLLNDYPQRARHIMKVCFEPSRTVSGRVHNVQHIRKETPNPKDVLQRIIKAYFRKDCNDIINGYKNDLVVYNPNDIADWLRHRKDAPQRLKDAMQFLHEQLTIKNPNDVKMHIKTEVLVKSDPISAWQQQQARSILANDYGMSSMFSAIFIEAKKRLKALLNEKTLYVDGLRPDEIASRLRHVKKKIHGFFENDLTKQDRQTDKPILDVEFLVYELLGIHPAVLSVYRVVHELWRLKSKYTRSYSRYMRLTGQVTTSLGNLITNLQVHSDFVLKNFDAIELILMLGDDMIMCMSRKPDIVGLRKHIAVYYNMQSKDEYNEDFGTFCQMIVHKTPTGLSIGPDLVRMKYKYEITNGLRPHDHLNIRMRMMSYMMMIGKNKQTDEYIKLMNLPIQPMHWYDLSLLTQATAIKYNISVDEVENHQNALLKMMLMPTMTTVEFKIWTSIARS